MILSDKHTIDSESIINVKLEEIKKDILWYNKVYPYTLSSFIRHLLIYDCFNLLKPEDREFFISKILTRVKPDSNFLIYNEVEHPFVKQNKKIRLDKHDIDILFKRNLILRIGFLLFLFEGNSILVERINNFHKLKLLTNQEDISVISCFLHFQLYKSSILDISFLPVDPTNLAISVNYVDENLRIRDVENNLFLSKVISDYIKKKKGSLIYISKNEITHMYSHIKQVFAIKK